MSNKSSLMNGYYSSANGSSICVVDASFYESLSQTNLISELLDSPCLILFGMTANYYHFYKRHIILTILYNAVHLYNMIGIYGMFEL